jgi:hypothetical protein
MPLDSTIVNLADADGDIFPFRIYGLHYAGANRDLLEESAWQKLREAEADGHMTFRHPGTVDSFEYNGKVIAA